MIVPNQAKSAGTILILGAHRIVIGPTSDLGPVDPQFFTRDGSSYSAKDLLAAVENAEQAIADNPETYPLHVSLLANVTAVIVQQARSAMGRSEDLIREACQQPGPAAEHEARLPKVEGASDRHSAEPQRGVRRRRRRGRRPPNRPSGRGQRPLANGLADLD